MNNFFQKAFKGNNDWPYYILGIVIIAIAYVIGQFPLILSLVAIDGIDAVQSMEQTGNFSSSSLGNNAVLALMILMFVVAFIGLLLVLKIQKKALIDITSGRDRIDFRRVFFAFFVWMGITAVFEFGHYLSNPDIYSLQFNLKSFFVLFVIVVILLPFQTSFEEWFFRGYLLQGIGLLFKNKIAALIITSILFSLVHSMNPEIEKYGFWNMQIYYIGAGLFLGLLTIMDDGLELALGVHAATNMFGALFVSYEGGVLQTDSVWRTDEINVHMANGLFYLSAVVFYAICRKKYGWASEEKVLMEKISKREQNIEITEINDYV